MRCLTVSLQFVLVVTALHTAGIAQNNSISLDSAIGVVDGDRIYTGSTVEFWLRVGLDPDNNGGLWAYTNAFRLYSPDGATWDTSYGGYLPAWPAFGERSFWWAGGARLGADTITFYGEDSAGGFLVVYDDVAWKIVAEIPDDSALVGKTICLDSVVILSEQGFLNSSWVWASLTTAYVPAWDGPHCFTIAEGCCQALTGNCDGDPGEIIDIGDVTRLIDYLYIRPDVEPLVCLPEANVDGDPGGVIDIGDVTRLVDYLYIRPGVEPPAMCPGAWPTGVIVGHDGCKSFLASAAADTASNFDCIEYVYDRGGLSIKHINAGFNCCPIIAADISIDGNTITIDELDSLDQGGCYCLCLFDVDYRIDNLPPGEYRIVVIEPYLPEGDEVLDFTVDLVSSPSGIHCAQRSNYPWGN